MHVFQICAFAVKFYKYSKIETIKWILWLESRN